MAKLWSDFFPYVQPHVPGCPESVMEDYIKQAVMDFCEVSEVWRRRLETDYTVSGVSDYQLSVPNASLLENITALYVEGVPLVRVSDFNHMNFPPSSTGQPVRYSVHDDREVRFYPTPDKRYAIITDCVLKPTLAATSVEDFIFSTHGRGIACGALATLMMIPNKEWTNPELAMYYQPKFDKAANDAKRRDLRRSGMRVASVNFA